MLITSLLMKQALNNGSDTKIKSKGKFTMFESDTLDEANKTAKIAGLTAAGAIIAHLWQPAANTVQGLLGRHVGDGEEDIPASTDV